MKLIITYGKVLSFFILLIISFSITKASFTDYFDVDYLNSDFTGISFSGNHVYVCGSLGGIIVSEDLGATWFKAKTNTDEIFNFFQHSNIF